MPTSHDKPHHPLPKDDRARHDLIPETVEEERDLGDDDPEADDPSQTKPPKRSYRDPAGKPYTG